MSGTGKSAGQKALAKKKAEQKEKKEDNTAKKDDLNEPNRNLDTNRTDIPEAPKTTSEITTIAKKSHLLKAMLADSRVSADVTEVLVEEHNQNHEAFYEAVENLDSPEGGKLILAMLNAIVRRQENQTTELLMFAYNLFPEMFKKLTGDQLKDVADIFDSEAAKYGGLTLNQLKALNLKSSAEIYEKIPNFDALPLVTQQSIVLHATGNTCRNHSTLHLSQDRAVIHTVATTKIASTASIDQDNSDTYDFKAVQMPSISTLNNTPIDSMTFLNTIEKRSMEELAPMNETDNTLAELNKVQTWADIQIQYAENTVPNAEKTLGEI